MLESIAAEHKAKERATRETGGGKTAVALSLVVVGLGHYRLGEHERGIVLFVAALASMIAAAFAPVTAPLTFLVVGYAAYDAYVGARGLKARGDPRPLTRPIAATAIISVIALLYALVA